MRNQTSVQHVVGGVAGIAATEPRPLFRNSLWQGNIPFLTALRLVDWCASFSLASYLIRICGAVLSDSWPARGRETHPWRRSDIHVHREGHVSGVGEHSLPECMLKASVVCT